MAKEENCGVCGSKVHKTHEHKGKKESPKHKALIHKKDEKREERKEKEEKE